MVETESVNSGYLEDIHGPITMTSSETVTPEPVSSEVKAERMMPISVSLALTGKPAWINESEIHAFMLGIEFAEKHHGISQ